MGDIAPAIAPAFDGELLCEACSKARCIGAISWPLGLGTLRHRRTEYDGKHYAGNELRGRTPRESC
jgi:hypothetical protein